MNSLITVAAVTAVLGSALVAGVFFAFSSFVMKALARVPSPEGIAAMQSINVVVINPSFLGAFVGTTLLSVGIAVLALVSRSDSSTIFFLGGASLYFVGTFLVTILGNVPLNDQLAAVSATNPDAASLWSHYMDRWTMWNHVRTVFAISATFLFTVGLTQNGAMPMQ